MTNAITAGLGALVVFSLGLLVLDLRERLRNRPREVRAGNPSPRSGLFIVAVLVVYATIQFAGVSLVPSVSQLIEGVRAWAGALEPPGFERKPGSGLTALVWVAAFYFFGLIDYLFHRFASHSRLLWFTHENHHLPKELYVYMPGIAARPFAVVAAFPAIVGLVVTLHFALTAFDLRSFDIVPLVLFLALAQLFISSASHSAFLRRHRVVHRLMKPFGLTTPQEHWYHHVQELDVNYGNFTTVWDRVFGTYLDPDKVDASRYRTGLDYDQDFLGTLTLGKLKLGQSFRERFQLEQFCYLEPETAD